jgi:hypothetical protein
MSPQQQRAKFFDDTGNVADATESSNEPLSYAYPDDVAYLNRCSALFEGLFDPLEPEIGRFLDALDDDDGIPKQSTESIPDISFRNDDENTLPSTSVDPFALLNDKTLDTSYGKPPVDPSSADINLLFVSPNPLSLETAPQESENQTAAFNFLAQNLSFDQSVSETCSSFVPDFLLSTANATHQMTMPQMIDVNSFENLMMVLPMVYVANILLQEMDFMNAFADPNGDFTPSMAYQAPQYPTPSNAYPPATSPTVPSQQITALDGSELRKVHAQGREISTQPQTRTRRYILSVSMANERRKRTIKAPVKANNPYGRGGTWACRLCRDRRWKVRFSLLMCLTRGLVRVYLFPRSLPAVSSPECTRSVCQSHCGRVPSLDGRARRQRHLQKRYRADALGLCVFG